MFIELILHILKSTILITDRIRGMQEKDPKTTFCSRTRFSLCSPGFFPGFEILWLQNNLFTQCVPELFICWLPPHKLSTQELCKPKHRN